MFFLSSRKNASFYFKNTTGLQRLLLFTEVFDVGEVDCGDWHGMSEPDGPPRVRLVVRHDAVVTGSSTVVAEVRRVLETVVARVDAALPRRLIQRDAAHFARVHCARKCTTRMHHGRTKIIGNKCFSSS